MPRSVPEWEGKTDDTPVPDRVKLRVFEKYKGVCHWSRTKILPGMDWDVDHIIALANGGKNVESNLAPILRGKPHKEKTRQDMAIKKKLSRTRKKHLGIKEKKPWNTKYRKKMSGEVVER